MIKTAGFEGPFSLLLGLIEKQKLHINDISLATVTEDYLAYMKKPDSVRPEELSSFIIVASTLILIKSKSLLPNLELSEEEQGDIKSLEERLRLFELFTRLGLNIKSDFGKQIIFAPEERKNSVVVFLPDSQITRESMMTCVKDVLGAMPQKTFMPEVEVRKVISIEEMIDKLTERIQSAIKLNFRDFANHKRGQVTREEKIGVIVGFLAMLEMVRQGIVDAVQEAGSDEIVLEKQSRPVES